MDEANTGKANEYLKQAEKKLKGGFGFGAITSLFGGGSSAKYEEAADLFEKAANLFKMSKQWKSAGDAFVRVAECHQKHQDKIVAADGYVKAATAYKKVSSETAIDCLRIVCDIYTDLGKFTNAAKYHKEIGDICEADADLIPAMENFQTAADYYKGEESNSQGNQCLLKVAHFAAQLENYPRAVEIYEQVAASSLDSPLLKFSVKEYFLKAGLCHMCTGDIIGAKRALEKYQDMDVSFSTQRECKFLSQLVEAYEAYDVEAFTQAVHEWDTITRLDSWKTSILLRIKNSMKDSASDLT